eukprot:s2307_g3.t1
MASTADVRAGTRRSSRSKCGRPVGPDELRPLKRSWTTGYGAPTTAGAIENEQRDGTRQRCQGSGRGGGDFRPETVVVPHSYSEPGTSAGTETRAAAPDETQGKGQVDLGNCGAPRHRGTNKQSCARSEASDAIERMSRDIAHEVQDELADCEDLAKTLRREQRFGLDDELLRLPGST